MATRRGKKLLRSETYRDAIEVYLCEHAPLSRFWVAGGLVQYADSAGQAMVLMDDDDDRVEACIALLEQKGCPVFAEESEIALHLAKLSNAKSSLSVT